MASPHTSQSKWAEGCWDSVPIQKVSVVCTHQVSTLINDYTDAYLLSVVEGVVTLNVDGVGWSACMRSKLVVFGEEGSYGHTTLITYSLVE